MIKVVAIMINDDEGGGGSGDGDYVNYDLH